MAFGSVELREAVLRERLDHAQRLINALEAALFDATGMVVCATCYRLKRTEHCPHCTGLEGDAEAKGRQS
jgi:hypothetical protein